MIKTWMKKIRTFLGLDYYVSDLDKKLQAFDQAHPKLGLGQRQEVEKHARVFKLRDVPVSPASQASLWDNF